MNDKIKQLAKEAGYYLYDLTETHECKTVETDSKNEWITLEKFAELIVRECLGCCEQVISDPVPKSVDTWLNGGEQCIQEIKEHFGLGMSVEDKKQLIKDLLGVSNDTKS